MKATKRQQIIAAMRVAENADPHGYPRAEHDIIYFVTDHMLTSEQRSALDFIGCHLDEESNSWAMFT